MFIVNCPALSHGENEYEKAMRLVKLRERQHPVTYCHNCGEKLPAMLSDFCDVVCAQEYFDDHGGF